MKTSIKFKILLLTMVAAVFNIQVKAQQNYVLVSGSELKVTGTSTLHDWEMKSAMGNGRAVINMDDQRIQSVGHLNMTLRAETLKSGKSGMDGNAYKALKTSQHPDITFVLREFRNIRQQGNATTFTAVGEMTIAGVKRTVTFNGNGKMNGDRIHFDGSTTFKLTDFKIDPPTAMMGTVRTGDDVTVSFNVVFQPVK